MPARLTHPDHYDVHPSDLFVQLVAAGLQNGLSAMEAVKRASDGYQHAWPFTRDCIYYRQDLDVFKSLLLACFQGRGGEGGKYLAARAIEAYKIMYERRVKVPNQDLRLNPASKAARAAADADQNNRWP